MFEASHYRSALIEALPHPLLFASVSGAHLYGFPSPDSDVDLRACHVLPVKAMLGLSPPKATVSRTWIVDGVEIDLVSHDLVKCVTLLLQPHGNYLEQLFSPLVVLDTPWAEELRSLVRHGAMSRRAYQPYAGYARSQWLQWRRQAVAGPAPLKPLLYAYRAALKQWQNYQSWRANRHPERAALEAVHGYDTKHAGHLLRLYTMGIEILREQLVRVRRPDAAWLRAVLGGLYSYDELMALVAELRRELAEAESASSLPAEPDAAAVEALVVDLQRRALGDARFDSFEA